MSNNAAHGQTMNLFEEYADQITHSGETEDSALQKAIDWTFRRYTDEFRADLYSKIRERWDKVEINLRFFATEHIIRTELHQ